ncbi:hypothetical protein E4U21_007032 [Claviceps maximensis]|nr:hypothetical protein E4U21_007032 [Claviceps maximensis]
MRLMSLKLVLLWVRIRRRLDRTACHLLKPETRPKTSSSALRKRAGKNTKSSKSRNSGQNKVPKKQQHQEQHQARRQGLNEQPETSPTRHGEV